MTKPLENRNFIYLSVKNHHFFCRNQSMPQLTKPRHNIQAFIAILYP